MPGSKLNDIFQESASTSYQKRPGCHVLGLTSILGPQLAKQDIKTLLSNS